MAGWWLFGWFDCVVLTSYCAQHDQSSSSRALLLGGSPMICTQFNHKYLLSCVIRSRQHTANVLRCLFDSTENFSSWHRTSILHHSILPCVCARQVTLFDSAEGCVWYPSLQYVFRAVSLHLFCNSQSV